jgi:sn-glycerol 3-phosphate transport system substrate-binding protein
MRWDPASAVMRLSYSCHAGIVRPHQHETGSIEGPPTTGKNIMTRLVRWAAGLAAAAALASPARAQTELQWWHAMTGGNNEVVVRLAEEFNASQREYKVVPTYKGSYPDTMNAGIAAFRAGNAPHILQVFEVGTATMMSAKGAVKPVFELMKEAGEPFDPKAYLPAITGYYSTAKGDMLSFPFNSSSMVMWINRDALKKAGLNADQPPKTWPEVFDAAKKLKSAGHATCGFSNAWATWANIEQLSAWHNQPLSTKANGLDGFDTVLEFNGPVQVRHLQTLVELQKDKTYDYSGRTSAGEGRFTAGECPIFLTSSGFYGNVKGNAKFDWAAVPMPYYPDVQGAPQNSIIGGASLWVMGGKSAPNTRASLGSSPSCPTRTGRPSCTRNPATCRSPVRPTTRPRRRASTTKPVAQTALIELTNKEPTENSRGLRLGQQVQLRDVWAEEIEAGALGPEARERTAGCWVARQHDARQSERSVSR